MNTSIINITNSFLEVFSGFSYFTSIGNNTLSFSEKKLQKSTELFLETLDEIKVFKLSEKEINELLILLKPCYSLLCFFSSQIKSSEETNNVKDLINSLVKEIEDFVLELEIESSKGQVDETKYLLTEPNRSILLNSIKTIENSDNR